VKEKNDRIDDAYAPAWIVPGLTKTTVGKVHTDNADIQAGITSCSACSKLRSTTMPRPEGQGLSIVMSKRGAAAPGIRRTLRAAAHPF
jgi:hypothetical protein